MSNEMTAAEYKAAAKSGKASKYNAEPIRIDGIRFASRAEGRRYEDLKRLKQGGAIRDLKLQPRFPIRIDGVLITTYVADFQYLDVATGEEVVEDVKSPITAKLPMYRLKKKLVKAIYGIDIFETGV